MTPSTATTGAITLGGTLGTGYGGTGLTSFTANGAVYASSTSVLTTGTLPVASGGTGLTTYTTGDLLYASGSGTLSKLGIGTTGQALVVSGGAPAWGAAGGATGGGTDQIFWNNGQTVNTSYSIPSNINAGTFGPVTIGASATVTIPSSSSWTVV